MLQWRHEVGLGHPSPPVGFLLPGARAIYFSDPDVADGPRQRRGCGTCARSHHEPPQASYVPSLQYAPVAFQVAARE